MRNCAVQHDAERTHGDEIESTMGRSIDKRSKTVAEALVALVDT